MAYRNGKAIAGISGPWSDRYALIWWMPQFASPQLELFESLQAAKDSVIQAFGEDRSNRHRSNRLFGFGRRDAFDRRDPSASRRPAWLMRLRRMLGPDRVTPNSTQSMRQRGGHEDIDLSGMHFSACR
ncbi:MAG TPA: hypothetical protein VIC31_08395 [Rudaea sp.]